MTNEEINALIAEKVFGPKPETRPSWSHQSEGGWTSSFKGIFTHKDYPPNQVGYPEPWYDWIPLKFSTDPAASKQLREKLAEFGYWELKQIGSGMYAFSIVSLIDEPTMVASDDTEEMAVALCALKALEKSNVRI